jgi:hypothetical protein
MELVRFPVRTDEEAMNILAKDSLDGEGIAAYADASFLHNRQALALNRGT